MKSSRMNNDAYHQTQMLDKVNSAQFSNESPDEHLWCYEDPQGNMQGDFSDSQMMEWLLAGRYFTPKLRLKRKCDSEFSSLYHYNILFQRIPFTRGSRILPLETEITDAVIKNIQKNQLRNSNESSINKLDSDKRSHGFSSENIANVPVRQKESIVSDHSFTNHDKEKDKRLSFNDLNSLLSSLKFSSSERINGSNENDIKDQLSLLAEYCRYLSHTKTNSRPSSFIAPSDDPHNLRNEDQSQIIQELTSLFPTLLTNGSNSNDPAVISSQIANALSGSNDAPSQKNSDSLSQSWPFGNFYNTSDVCPVGYNSNNNNKQGSLWSSPISFSHGVSRSVSEAEANKSAKAQLKNESIANNFRADHSLNSFVQHSPIHNHFQPQSMVHNGSPCNTPPIGSLNEPKGGIQNAINSNNLDSSLNWPVWSSYSNQQKTVGFGDSLNSTNHYQSFIDSDGSGSPSNILDISQPTSNTLFSNFDDRTFEKDRIVITDQVSPLNDDNLKEKSCWSGESSWSRSIAKPQSWASKSRTDVNSNSNGKTTNQVDHISSKSNEKPLQVKNIDTPTKSVAVEKPSKKERQNKSQNHTNNSQVSFVDTDLAKLIRWTQDVLSGVELREQVDIPTIVELLASIDAPYEVETMFKSYLGDTPRIQQFIRDFLDRRRPYWHKQRQKSESTKQKSKTNGSQSPTPKSHIMQGDALDSDQVSKQTMNQKKKPVAPQIGHQLSDTVNSIDNSKKSQEGQWKQSKPKNGRKNKKATNKCRV